MRQRAANLAGIGLCVGSGVGCDAYRRSQARAQEQFLVTAGFSAERATTPEARARFAALPERRIVEQRAPVGEPTCLFSDPGNCCCVYVGDAEEYAHDPALEAHVARERKRDLDVVLFGDSSR